MLSVRLNFVVQSVLYSGTAVIWCSAIRPLSKPVRHNGEMTVFWEVDRSVMQIKFHLKSYLIPDRKTEERNLCFETLSI